VWDRADLDCFVGKARVLDADGGNIYKAIWACLLQLESRLHRYAADSTLTALPI